MNTSQITENFKTVVSFYNKNKINYFYLLISVYLNMCLIVGLLLNVAGFLLFFGFAFGVLISSLIKNDFDIKEASDELITNMIFWIKIIYNVVLFITGYKIKLDNPYE